MNTSKRMARFSAAAAVGGLILATPGFAGNNGDFTADVRLRVETAEVEGTKDADNISIRVRPGYFSPDIKGFTFGIEGEFTVPFDKDSYNAAGVHGDSSRAVIADPESQDLDQLFLQYVYEDTMVKLGRQVITLDNHRFVGHVGWRQNRQTYDAATIRNTSVENLTLFYGYIDGVSRIFGSEAPGAGANAGETDSESHLLNASYKASDEIQITPYASLLELNDPPATLSADSIGVSLKGKVSVNDEATVGYHAEYARQNEAGKNPLNYTADYIHLALNGSAKGIHGGIGYERLGGDQAGVDTNGAPVYASFKTPLATLHKFNGFADQFLVTPARGLEDIYISIGFAIPVPAVGSVDATIIYHDFTAAEGGGDLGDEIDAVLARKFEIEDVPGTFNA
ncbi:MAG: alginate export family protein, partial [Verrucomicrobia bacterium]|nr:alginate export family protein [Verrucomicrobiota bacterium]